MNRRQYLGRSAAAVGALATVAGCLDRFENAIGDASGEDDDSSADAESGPERRADRNIKRAVGRLNKAALSLQAVEEQLEEPDSVAFDAGEPRDRIERAREELVAAEVDATADQRADVAELRTFADVLERAVDVTATLADGDFRRDLEAVQTAVSERRFDEAKGTIAAYREEIGASIDRLDPALDALETMDRNRLESLDIVEIDAVDRGATGLANVLSSLDALGAGYEPIVTGTESLLEGEAAIEDRELDRADRAIDSARADFDEASGTFRDARGDAPAGLGSHFDAALCRSTNLGEAATRYAEAVEAAREMDRTTAREKRDEADRLVAEADRCGEE